MATRETMYATNTTGYEAMVADFTEMFDWDVVEESAEGAAETHTDFKKLCGGDAYIALRIVLRSTLCPAVQAVVFNGTATFVATGQGEDKYVNYAYGNGFFALCGTSNLMPNTNLQRNIVGVSTCRNILTGEVSWCSFTSPATTPNSGIEQCDYYLLSKDSKAAVLTDGSFTANAKIGAAVSLHCTSTGCVSDKIFSLTAIPDSYWACMTPVIFNGVQYIRLGTMLVPSG